MEIIKEENLVPEKVKTLELLVDELMKSSPDEIYVKELMEKAELGYIADPIERINSVLKALLN